MARRCCASRTSIYLADAALRNAVLLRGEEVLADPDELGKVVETSVLARTFTPTTTSMFQASSIGAKARTNKEVDVIVKSPRYVIPVEVKYRKCGEPGFRRLGLITYCEKDPKVRYAYLRHPGGQGFQHHRVRGDAGPHSSRIPAHVFTYLFGQAEHYLWKQAGRRAEPVPSLLPEDDIF